MKFTGRKYMYTSTHKRHPKEERWLWVRWMEMWPEEGFFKFVRKSFAQLQTLKDMISRRVREKRWLRKKDIWFQNQRSRRNRDFFWGRLWQFLPRGILAEVKHSALGTMHALSSLRNALIGSHYTRHTERKRSRSLSIWRRNFKLNT